MPMPPRSWQNLRFISSRRPVISLVSTARWWFQSIRSLLPGERWVRNWTGGLSCLIRPWTQYKYFPDVDSEVDVATALTSAFAWRQPHHPEVAFWRQRADTLWPQINSESSMIANATILAYMDMFFGDLERAAVKLSMVEPVVKNPAIPPFNRTFIISALGHLAMFRGEAGRCCELAQEGRENRQ